MFNDDEEKRKREEEARNIISSLNPQDTTGSSINFVNYSNDNNYKINVNNENEQTYIDKINEANSIINSINPRMEGNIQEPTQKEREESRRNTQEFINLIDNGIQQPKQEEQEIQLANTTVNDNKDDNKATSKQRKAVDIIMNKKTIDEVKQEDEENTSVSEQTSKNSNILTDIRDFFENLFFGSSSGVKQTLKYVETANEQNFDNYEKIRERQYMSSPNVSMEDKTAQKQSNNLLHNNRLELASENIKKYGTITNPLYNSDGKETNLVKKGLQDSIDQDTLEIQENVNNASNPISQKLMELAPSIGQMTVGWGASAVNPMLGISYFMTSAGGSYIDDAKDRGMNDEQAFTFGTIMGAMEGVTEEIGISKLMKGGKALSKGVVKEALKNYGLNATDNFIQEAIIEPISEATATIVAGKEKANWDNMSERMLQAGIDGALSALIMDGASAGINSSIRLVNKIRNNEDITNTEIKKAIQDINKNEDIDVENTIENEMNYQIQENSNTDNYIVARYNNENDNLELYNVKGEAININNNDLNIAPAVVKMDGVYNVIDSNSGLELYTTRNTNKQNTITEFKERIDNLDKAGIQNINNQVTQNKLGVINKLQEVENNPQAIQNFQVQQNQDNFSRGNINTNIQENNEQISNPKVRDLRTAISQIQDNSYYNGQKANEIIKTIADNFDNVTYTPKQKSSTLTIRNDKGNTMYSKEIRNNIGYSGKSIKSILSNVYNYVMNDTSNGNNSQTSSEQNASNFYSNETNYAVQDINNVTEPFTKQESYSRDELAEIWNDEVSGNNYDAYYDSNGNIERYIAIEEEGNNIVVNQYDNNDNIVKSEVIPSENGRYKASDIQDTLNRVASIYDENSPIKGQQDIEGNEVKSMKKKTNKTTLSDEEIRDIVKYNPDGKEIKDTDYVDFMLERFKDNQNISKVKTDTKYINTIKDKSQNDKITDLFKKIKNKSIQGDKVLKNRSGNKENVHLDVLITKTGLNESFHKSISDEKYAIVPYLDVIIETSQDGIIRDETKNRKNIKGWYYLYNTAEINGKLYSVKVDLKQTQQGDRLYVHRVNLIHKEELPSQAITDKSARDTVGQEVPLKNSIPQNDQTVKKNTASNKSMQNNKNNTSNNTRSMKQSTNKVTDSEGRILTKQQQEYFKDSKVRDKNGDLQVVYHGTNNFGFTEFNRNANYYTSRKDVASTYTGNNGIYIGYLDIKNPIVIDANKEKWSMIDIDNIKINGIDNIREFLHEQGASVWQEKGKSRTTTADIVQAISDAIDEGQINADGIIIQNIYDEGSYSNGEAKIGTDYITFKSNQFKNLDNISPTTNDDIRYMKKNNSKNQTKTNTNTKNLIAQHNTSEEKLMEALDLGALPVPSIAITKSNTPISNYGDITLLFNKNTINPTDRRNVAYNSDIYSTRRPQTVNSLDKNKVKTFEKSMNNKGISYGYISQIEEYIQNNNFTRAKETIKYELQKANPDITEQEIEDSFTEAMSIIKDKRILKEGVDPYTPSGNRKSIEQMSVPYTLDNIVRLMTKKSNKGSESNNFAGLPEVRANLSQQFKNIEEMHKQESNLVSTEEMQKIKEELNNEFYNLIDEIGKYDKVERYFGSADTVANALNETAKAKNISKEVLENELDFVSITDVPDKTLQKAVDFLNSLKNIPTEYFEVKPQRAVGLNEIQSVIVPKNTSKELIDKLKENNIPVTYYNTEQERNKLISNETKNKDIRFAKKTAKTPKVDEVLEPGQTNAQRESNYIEQEIRKIEQNGNWDDSIPVTKMTNIRKTIEDYLGLGVQKGHFRQQAYGIYKGKRDVIRTKELKDIDTILHETGHALDIGNRIKIDKESISNELLKAVNNYGGYETETREIQLEEGFAEVIREYTIVPEQAKIDYPQTVAVLEGIRRENQDFDNFIRTVQEQTYNYIHQNPENRILSNVSIGEQTDKRIWTKASTTEAIMRAVYDKDWSLKSVVNELQKIQGKTTQELKASENAYYLTRLTSGIGGKITSMLSNGYIDENGNKLMPGLNQLGEILGDNHQRFDDLRAYLVAKRDLEYKAKTLKTGIRTMDSKAVVEQFKNDVQIQEASQLVYDTLDGVMQYAVNNGLISQETADALRESNVFYVPMQRVLGDRGNNIGRRGAVTDVIKARTGSELDVKDVLENIVSNSANIIQQVENNNVLKALYSQGEQAGITGKIYDVIDTPMVKVGTAKLSAWKSELKNQGVDINTIDLDKTIDLFAPNNKIDARNLITSFINEDGKRVYLQFTDDVLFNSLMNMDRKFMSTILNINRKFNMPLRYGATMANIGFAIPNVISDTVQATIFSEAGFIPVVDNLIGIMDIVSAQNKGAREFFNKVMPGYADRINTLYAIYEQTGATNSTRLSQYRESTQVLMKDVYGTKNSEVLGIKEKYKPLKRLLDVLTYTSEISEQSTRFRVFEKSLEYYRKNGMEEMDARIKSALQSRDATQDFGRTGNVTREINQLIPFSSARVGSIYTFAEKVQDNPKRVAMRMAILMAISMGIKAIGHDDDEIEELNQRKKDDNFVLKVGDQIVTIKKPQGILRSIVNLGEYVQDLFTGHIEEGKEGERLAELVQSAIMDNMPADSVTGLVPNMVAPVVENAINKDLYYNSDIVKSYDLELPDSEQYYDYNSQLAIWLGQIFNYSPAKIDNLISGYFAGLGTSVTNVIDWIAGKTGISVEQPEMGAEDNAIAKRFIVNVNSNSASVDEVYDLKTELTKKKNGGTITSEESQQLEDVTNATSEMAKLNKQIKEIKKDLTMSGKEKAEQIKLLQQQKTDTARKALGKNVLYSDNETNIESTTFYPSRDTLSQNGYTLNLTSDMKKEYEELAYNRYKQYENQGLYSEEKLEKLREKCKDYAKSQLLKKYKNDLIKSK